MQRFILAALALIAVLSVAVIAVERGRRLLGPTASGERTPALREAPVQKVSFVLLAALILYVSLGGG